MIVNRKQLYLALAALCLVGNHATDSNPNLRRRDLSDQTRADMLAEAVAYRDVMQGQRPASAITATANTANASDRTDNTGSSGGFIDVNGGGNTVGSGTQAGSGATNAQAGSATVYAPGTYAPPGGIVYPPGTYAPPGGTQLTATVNGASSGNQAGSGATTVQAGSGTAYAPGTYAPPGGTPYAPGTYAPPGGSASFSANSQPSGGSISVTPNGANPMTGQTMDRSDVTTGSGFIFTGSNPASGNSVSYTATVNSQTSGSRPYSGSGPIQATVNGASVTATNRNDVPSGTGQAIGVSSSSSYVSGGKKNSKGKMRKLRE